MVLKGFSVAAMPALAASMAADTVDIDFARTGEHRAGLYFAIWGFLRKGSYAIGGAVALAAFAFVGFDPTADIDLAGTPDGNSEASFILAHDALHHDTCGHSLRITCGDVEISADRGSTRPI